jgi:hypothetical protein
MVSGSTNTLLTKLRGKMNSRPATLTGVGVLNRTAGVIQIQERLKAKRIFE